jgi:hypothetical protein
MQFAEKLAKLGYRESSGKRRNHHRKSPVVPVPEPKAKQNG